MKMSSHDTSSKVADAQACAYAEVKTESIIRFNGALYKRQDGPFTSWKVLSMPEKRERMKKYMREYRRRKHKAALGLDSTPAQAKTEQIRQ